MASKRFLIVPEDSSAASRPLPGATMARATLLRSARFIGASFRKSALSLRVKLDGSRATTKQASQETAQNKRSTQTFKIKRLKRTLGPRGGRLARPARAAFTR